VVPGYDEERLPEAAQECRRRVVLGGFSAVREVAGGDHEFGLDLLDQGSNRPCGGEVVGTATRAHVKVRHVEDAALHRRRRLQ
jgi:hypothetical protein